MGGHTHDPKDIGCLLQLFSALFTEAECLVEPGVHLASPASHLIPEIPWPCPLNAGIIGGFLAYSASVWP